MVDQIKEFMFAMVFIGLVIEFIAVCGLLIWMFMKSLFNRLTRLLR